MSNLVMLLVDEAASVEFGRSLAQAIGALGCCIYLQGDLGAGKTTLSRGLIQYFGHRGAVKSPTYTLVEPYELAAKRIYHFDFYRLAEPSELAFLGLDDYFSAESLCLIEWPERGANYIPRPDIELLLRYEVAADSQDQRSVTIVAHSDVGQTILQNLKQPVAASACHTTDDDLPK